MSKPFRGPKTKVPLRVEMAGVTLPRALTARLTCLGLVLSAAASFALAAPGPASAASVKWRVELPGQYILYRPVEGPNGNIAVVTSTGALYSLAPDGAVRWVVPSIAGSSAPSFGADGTVYVGNGESASPRSRRTGRSAGPTSSPPTGRE
jgi:post-segregation antitoxin (ccd killing protein)